MRKPIAGSRKTEKEIIIAPIKSKRNSILWRVTAIEREIMWRTIAWMKNTVSDILYIARSELPLTVLFTALGALAELGS